MTTSWTHNIADQQNVENWLQCDANEFVEVSLSATVRPTRIKKQGKYRKVSNIRRTKSQNLNVSRLIL